MPIKKSWFTKQDEYDQRINQQHIAHAVGICYKVIKLQLISLDELTRKIKERLDEDQ